MFATKSTLPFRFARLSFVMLVTKEFYDCMCFFCQDPLENGSQWPTSMLSSCMCTVNSIKGLSLQFTKTCTLDLRTAANQIP